MRIDFGGTVFAAPQDEETNQLSRSSISMIMAMVKLLAFAPKLTLDKSYDNVLVLVIGRMLYVDIR